MDDRNSTQALQTPTGLHLPRPTIRLRLTILYGSLFLICGAVLLAITYTLVSRATGNPVVYTTQAGEVIVAFNDQTIGGFPAPPVGSGFVTGGPEQIQTVATQQHAAELNQLIIWSIVALAIMVVVSIWIGWLLAGRVLQPLRSMTSTVREISASNLRQRVAADGPDDELKDLGSTFDELLGRLDRSFEAQRQFVANASHELRTPLARQRTLIQVALDDPAATVDSLRATCERVLAAEAQQEELIEALLTMARSERDIEPRERVDLAQVAARVVDARRAEIDGHGLALEARLDAAAVSGNQHLLERLVANLVDNAIRYNIQSGRVDVATATVSGAAIVRVTNSGPVVPADEVERLFEPFQRLGTDRIRHGDGLGLGLSIVRAIAAAHGGAVTAQARPSGGLEIEARFPIAAVTPG